MSEKILIKSERYNLIIIILVFVVVGLIAGIIVASPFYSRYEDNYNYHEHSSSCYTKKTTTDSKGRVAIDQKTVCKYSEYSSGEEYAKEMFFAYDKKTFLIPFFIAVVVGVIIFLWLNSYELTVTDKRIYGTIGLSKRVDLPLDSVSSTSLSPGYKGVSVSTSSGNINFILIKNSEKIYETISSLLIERQQEQKNIEQNNVIQKADETDRLKKYKELLDSGVITQEEFDLKKKQLLDL